MSLRVAALTAAVSILFSFSAVAQSPGDQYNTPVTESFGYSEMRGTGELGLVLAYYSDLQDANGYVALCGAYFLRERRAQGVVSQALANATLSRDGVEIHRNIRFFRHARSLRQLPNATARCVVTNARTGGGNYLLNISGGTVRM